jgi:phospholipid/cholesterol/gamma-HCH transport system ATP-binding protein
VQSSDELSVLEMLPGIIGIMKNQNNEVLKIESLCKSFERVPLICDMSLSLKEGEKLAILGPGGCGKSTLLKIILGIIAPDSGTVEILGENLPSLNRTRKQEVLSQVGMAFQQGALFDFMTVRENILFAMENMTSLPRLEMEERVSRMLAEVYLPAAARKIPSELSGGMRRRVGIVRALATDPKIALLDEPTAGLDPVTSAVVIDMIHRLGSKIGSTLICVTSSVEVAFTFSPNVALMKDGSILGRGTWDELHNLNNSWITHFLDVRGFSPPNR